MSLSQLKWLAIVTMLIDHIGAIFFPEILLFRIVGRLSFPIFAWLAAVGVEHTHDWKRYVGRLALFGIFAEWPYLLARHIEDPHFVGLNVLFTLLLGVAAVALSRRAPMPTLAFFPIAAAAILAEALRVDYGAFGVILIALFAFLRKRPTALVVLVTLCYLLPHLLLIGAIRELDGASAYLEYFIQLFSLLALPFILTYDPKKDTRPRFPLLFYFIYPLQFLVLVALHAMIST